MSQPCEEQGHIVKGHNPKLDVIFQSQMTAMASVLNLYLNLLLTFKWWDASLIITKSVGKGIQEPIIIDNTLHPSWMMKILFKTSKNTRKS